MLLVVTSAGDPELRLLVARPSVAIVVPAHLSQSGWVYEVGSGATARLCTSRGEIGGDEISGVLTRIQRVDTGDLAHIHEDDREYVAAEMTAFLAAFISDLSCPLFNRPTANSLWGPSWTSEYWWRASAKEGFPVCCNRDGACSDFADAIVVGSKVIYDKALLPESAVQLSRTLAARAGVSLLASRFCKTHGAFQGASLRPELRETVLDKIEELCALTGSLT